jgi:hypothetical protein
MATRSRANVTIATEIAASRGPWALLVVYLLYSTLMVECKTKPSPFSSGTRQDWGEVASVINGAMYATRDISRYVCVWGGGGGGTRFVYRITFRLLRIF